MNKVQESLEANKAEILAALPADLKAGFDKEIAAAVPAPVLTPEETVAAIKAELKENPDVDEAACAAELTNIAAPVAVAAPTEAELEVQKAAALKAAEAMGAHTPEEA